MTYAFEPFTPPLHLPSSFFSARRTLSLRQIFAINQHGDAGAEARKAMGADLASLEHVIKYTPNAILYWDPIDNPAPLKRLWW